MKASELMIGNLVDDNGLIETVISDHLINDEHYDGLKGCLPIPLTEEWLLKFGFDINRLAGGILKVSSYKTYEEKELEIWNTDNGIELMINNEPNDICLFFSLKNIKYVHQLQNLYFALTGNELEIKE